MTTPYGISTSIGSQTFQGYVNAAIGGPLNSSQYPNAMPYHSYGILTGQRPTPPQFYPGQEPVNANMSVYARAHYLRATALSARQKAIQDSIDIATASFDDIDLDVMWENTVWEEIDEITEVYGEVEQITAVAGVRGAEAEDEALNHLYYRRSMKGLALIDLQKAYGKLSIKRENLIKINPNHPKLEKIDNLLSQLKIKMKKV